MNHLTAMRLTPLPAPPPQGGREPLAAMAGINPIAIDYFAGAGEGLKSTFGAVEISFSLSTVKLAFSL